MRVVGSLTTIPGRYPKLLRTLKSLCDQDHNLDCIYLGIPEKSRRLGEPYPELPTEITELATIVSCDNDYGPCTKIVGGLIAEANPETIIITFDDDVVYSRNLVSSLLAHHKTYPNSAIGSSGVILKYGFPFYSTYSNCGGHWNRFTGFTMEEGGRAVDALCGFSAVLYVRKFFPDLIDLHDKFLKYPLMDNDVYFNDDIMISAYLSGNNIERRVVPDVPMPNENKVHDPILDALDGNEISFNKLAFLQRFHRSIKKTKQWGFYANTEDITLDETVGGRITITIIFVLIIILGAIVLWTMIPK